MSEAVFTPGEAEEVKLGWGYLHPDHPDLNYRGELDRMVEQHPFLRGHEDYLRFLQLYAGMRVYTRDKRDDGGFLHATVYGAGQWSFSEECANPVSPDGYFVFAVIEYQIGDSGHPTVGSGGDLAASFGFDSRGAPGVYAERHIMGDPDSLFTLYCNNFDEWMRRFSEAKGLLLPNI